MFGILLHFIFQATGKCKKHSLSIDHCAQNSNLSAQGCNFIWVTNLAEIQFNLIFMLVRGTTENTEQLQHVILWHFIQRRFINAIFIAWSQVATTPKVNQKRFIYAANSRSNLTQI